MSSWRGRHLRGMALDDLVSLAVVLQYIAGAVRNPWFPMARHGRLILKHVHAKNLYLSQLQSRGVHVKAVSVLVLIASESSLCRGDIVSVGGRKLHSYEE